MATTLGALRTRVRTKLIETTASYWSDAELLDHLIDGVKDLWGAIIDLHQEHFDTEDATNVSLAASTGTLTGVPSDCFRITLIEPRDTTSTGAGRGILFIPRDFNHDDFVAARTRGTLDQSSGGVVYYCMKSAGPPVGTVSVRIAPMLSAALPLRFCYVPSTSPSLDANSSNPIPGESDKALISYAEAFARGKEREDRSPDPGALAVYKTEKDNILTRLTPRQTQEPQVVQGIFESEWGY